MPKGSWQGQHYAQCPFYRSDDRERKKIICEGIVDKSWLGLYFDRKKTYETQLNVFCCEHYKKCEIYRMLMKAKYDDEED